jgi:NAD(P)-dependent dehydrogenase (short-subunit alcohol dehydrogenase family)
MTTTRPVALVTGASSGIGLAAAVAHVDASVQVVGTSRDTSHVAVRDRVTFLDRDVAGDESASTAVEQVIARLDRIDVLVNNAGIGSAGADEELSVAQNQRVFDVNVVGVIQMTNAVLPHMRALGRLPRHHHLVPHPVRRKQGPTDTPMPVYAQQRHDVDELMATAIKETTTRPSSTR